MDWLSNGLGPKIPLDIWVEDLVSWLDTNVGWLFDGINAIVGFIVNLFEVGLGTVPHLIVIAVLALLTWKFAGRNVALVVLVGFLLITNLGYWENTVLTISLVVTASLISVIFGVPLGIWASKKDLVQRIVTPILDFMQTMPAFVYLIPAVFFFGTGAVPGVIASVIFAMPPTIRLTNLGIRQVPKEMVEAADAFGSTPMQKLLKIQMPIAKPTIMAGINQTIMLALSMVVIGSMIGARGLGADVFRAVTRIQIGVGFEAGMAVVILAVLLDRVTQNLGKK